MTAWTCPRCKLTNTPTATHCDCGYSALTQQTSTAAPHGQAEDPSGIREPTQPGDASPRLQTAAMASYAVCLVCWTTAPGNWAKLKSLELPELVGRLLGAVIGLALLNLFVVGIASLWRSNRTARRRTLVSMITSLVMSAMIAIFTARLAARSSTDSQWDYRADEHGIVLTLPSSRWKRAERQVHLADFVMPDLAPTLAGILSVEKGGRDRFDALSTDVRSDTRRNSEADQQPRFQASETSSGTHYAIAFWIESAEALNGKLWVARCASWLAHKGLLVTMYFERQGAFIGRTGQAVERTEFEDDATAICQSVR